MWAFGVLIWEVFTLIDKDLDESDEEIITYPYHQLSSKEQVRFKVRMQRIFWTYCFLGEILVCLSLHAHQRTC